MPDIQKVGATVIAITHGLTGDVRAAFNRTVKTSFPIISDEDGLINSSACGGAPATQT